VISGGNEVIKLSNCGYLELRDLVIEGAFDNGINIDDKDPSHPPSHDVVLRGLVLRNIGHGGNNDAIKLSGVDRFRVENCVIEGWGANGSAIDIVGCHDGVIEGCTFRRKNEGINGIEVKGGCRNIVIRRCRFESAGDRAVQIGGITGRIFFRPPPPEKDACEARDITVEGCTFIGSEAPIAFVGSDGCVARFNTIYHPGKWVLRILQESVGPEFVPCRGGQFTDNLIVFRAASLQTTVNIGEGTAPETFRFARNFWYCSDQPTRSQPRLPTAEEGAVIGADPLLIDPEHGDLNVKPESPAKNFGAHALPAG